MLQLKAPLLKLCEELKMLQEIFKPESWLKFLKGLSTPDPEIFELAGQFQLFKLSS